MKNAHQTVFSKLQSWNSKSQLHLLPKRSWGNCFWSGERLFSIKHQLAKRSITPSITVCLRSELTAVLIQSSLGTPVVICYPNGLTNSGKNVFLAAGFEQQVIYSKLYLFSGSTDHYTTKRPKSQYILKKEFPQFETSGCLQIYYTVRKW